MTTMTQPQHLAGRMQASLHCGRTRTPCRFSFQHGIPGRQAISLTSVANRVHRPVSVASVSRAASRSRAVLPITAAEGWNPPTVADTKKRFLEGFRKPVSPLYNTVIQELIVVQHLLRWNRKYKYDKVFALGFVSVYDQVIDGLTDEDKEAIFNSYVAALEEDPKQYRADAAALEAWAKGLESSEALKPDAEGDEVQKTLADIAARAKDGSLQYNRFFAIGLFRLLELTGAKDPKALESLVNSIGVRADLVNRDLLTYKGVLSKLSAAKDMMKEYLERERRKQAERDAEKAAKAEANSTTSAETPVDAAA